MKTSVELNNDKIELARKEGGAKTLRELLDKALDAYISQCRRNSLAELLGKGFFDGDLSAMRERNGRSR